MFTSSATEGNTRIIIIGGGFAGLSAAKYLGNKKNIEVLLIDKNNHHLFQPLLYQVAIAELSATEIASPIRSVLRKYKNVKVMQDHVKTIDAENKKVICQGDNVQSYDYLLFAAGAKHHYFGNEQWEVYAPGLKTISQAVEIRRRVLSAFERAEREPDKTKQRALLTFIVVGGGATGVELAGAIGELTRQTLVKDFRNIDSKQARIILIEGGDYILNGFSLKLRQAATQMLESLGVQVWTNSLVSNIDANGLNVGEERIKTTNILWAAGVRASDLTEQVSETEDPMMRIDLDEHLRVVGHTHIFAAGDVGKFIPAGKDKPLPGLAPVAMSQGIRAAKNIYAEVRDKPLKPYKYFDRGTMATIGKNRAIAHTMGMDISGYIAWLSWLLVHIYFLIGHKNRTMVLIKWVSSYLTASRGARIIIDKDWRFYRNSRSGLDDGESKE